MKQTLLPFFFVVLMASCGSQRKALPLSQKSPQINTEGRSITKNTSKTKTIGSKADKVVSAAVNYLGVRYRYGGTDSRGMDCSGLIYTSLQENDIPFPRVSKAMASEGKRINLHEVVKGDLIFFNTKNKGGKINHVGLVVENVQGEIKFIHSSTSSGVLISSLRDRYWNSAFVKATRIF